MSHSVLQPGCACSFFYPRHNFRQSPSRTEERRIRVSAIRDTLIDPLDPATVTLNPHLKRGRWIVTGLDLDKQGERSFYVESMSNIQQLPNVDQDSLAGFEYVVIDQDRVIFKCCSLVDALAFRTRRSAGTICGVMCHSRFAINHDMSNETDVVRCLSRTYRVKRD